MTLESWQIFFSTILILYTGQAWFVCLGLWRTHKKPQRKSSDDPFISIIVAARNEASNIAAALNTLVHIDYQPEKFEVIVVDDDSHDNTSKIVNQFCHKHKQVKLIQQKVRIANLNGKASAIHTAMQEARGEFIFITDADCRVPATWVRTHIDYYQKETGMVGGFIILTDRHTPSNLFAKIQSLEWLYVTAVGCGISGLGVPLSIFGNNMSFRKNVYDRIGGFPAIGFSLVEDYALMRAIQKHTDYKIKLLPDPRMTVQTNPVSTLQKLYIQRKRWAVGSRGFSFFTKLMMLLGLIGKLIPLILLLFSYYAGAFAALLVILFSDYLILLFALFLIQRKDQLKSFLLYELFVMIYPILLAPFFLFSRSVKWKDRDYSGKG